ncbi:YtxH domain-containing protein [Bradyrhizobium barranii subsp. barranii]|uniref:YtxH domain-containing protein n=1 Tax=Bradyrhizobium barranii subsp. barranii TaxID=2823807 RepID=A0A939S9V1_9BRAD|nr:YtxH domain-containing protein [Bradyrhizobium barranii]UEM12346.1 YtxH domain-containing protein [Bradyrhizobium barranii subsp. barranii]
MSIPAFLGFLIGAAIGAVATSTSGPELRAEAVRWITEARWTIYLNRPTWRFPAVLSAILNLLQVEILLILVSLWLLGLVWAIFSSPTWSDQTYIRYIVGSLVGMAAAPWIWLHFSRSFDVSKTDGGVASESGQLPRYRFVSFVLGAALLVAMLHPYMATWLTRTNKIEGFGVALSFVQPRNERGSQILQVGQQAPTSLGQTSSRLASATSRAHLVATGHPDQKPGTTRRTLKDVTTNLEGFSDLSVIDRDKVYIAYFEHERSARRGQPTLSLTFANLQEYVNAASPKIDQGPDDAFLAELADFSECISLYAENVRDFRLFLVESNVFLRSLLVDVAAQWSERGVTFPAPQQMPINQREGSTLNLKKFDALALQVVQALKKRNVHTSSDVCGSVDKLTKKVILLNGVGKTPYPAYQIAHYMAAIDSVETGVLILRDWIFRQHTQYKPDFIRSDPEQGWYAIRAMLTSSQLPYRFGSVSPTHRSLVKFQQETTERIAALLNVRDGRSWRSLCERLSERGLHAQIGRYLAMTYADERNYLYELLRPEDFGLAPGEDALKSTDLSPATYLEEAEAILGASGCFEGVPRFNRQLISVYYLNAAQLRYSLRILKEGDEKLALTQKIRADLEQARQLDAERERENSRQISIVEARILDLLRQPEEFEPHRARLAEFRKILDKESAKD